MGDVVLVWRARSAGSHREGGDIRSGRQAGIGGSCRALVLLGIFFIKFVTARRGTVGFLWHREFSFWW